MRPKLDLSLEIRQKAIALYAQDISEREICKKIGYSSNVLKRILNDSDIKKRIPISISQPYRLYSVNEKFFDNPETWTEKQAYWLGWLYSDGSNSGKQFSIRLQESDKYILETLKNLIDYTGPVRLEKRSPSSIMGGPVKQYQHRSVLSISNLEMCKKISELGVSYNSSCRIEFPTYLKECLYPHFLRGLFEGDGCFSFNKRNMFDFNLVVSVQLGGKIIEIFDKLGCTSFLDDQQDYKNGVKTLRLTGPNQGIKIFNYFYENATYWLPRKIEAMNRLLEYKQRIHPRHSNKTDLQDFQKILKRLNETANSSFNQPHPY